MSGLKTYTHFVRPPNVILRASYATRAVRRQNPSPLSSRSRSSRPPPPVPISRRRANSSDNPPQAQPSPSDKQSNAVDSISTALRGASPQDNNLLAPVHIPEDPNAVLNERHAATSILANSSIVITRQLELMNVMLGFEQANKYVIMDPHGNHVGYMAERDLGMGSMMARQMFSTHRSFTTHVFDKYGKEVLRFHRPFSWISSRIGVYDPLEPNQNYTSPESTSLPTVSGGSLTTELTPGAAQTSELPLSAMRIIGEAHQQWAPLRRKYNLFLYRGSVDSDTPQNTPQLTSGDLPLSNSKALQPLSPSDQPSNNAPGQFSQFAYINEPFLSWDFSLLSQDSRLLGSVNRNFAGFGREIFTDTGVYALRMDAAALAQEPSHLVSQTAKKAEVLGAAGNEAGMTLDQRAVMLATAVSVDFDYFSRHSGGSGIGGGFMPMWFPGMGGGGGEAGEAAGGAAGGSEGVDGSPTNGSDAGSPYDQGGQRPGEVGQGEDVWGQGDDPWGGQGGGGGGDGGGGGGGWGDFFDS